MESPPPPHTNRLYCRQRRKETPKEKNLRQDVTALIPTRAPTVTQQFSGSETRWWDQTCDCRVTEQSDSDAAPRGRPANGPLQGPTQREKKKEESLSTSAAVGHLQSPSSPPSIHPSVRPPVCLSLPPWVRLVVAVGPSHPSCSSWIRVRLRLGGGDGRGGGVTLRRSAPLEGGA